MALVLLERPSRRREREFLDSVARSRPLHAAYVAAPASPEEYRAYLNRQRRGNQESYFVVERDSGRLAGVVNVNDIVRYSLQSASLGYYAFVPFAGRGLMREALRIVVGLAFKEHGLHRLEANIQPDNHRSIALVSGLGFRLEGLSPRFLKIGGRWRDHLRWAILAEEWRPGHRGHGPGTDGTRSSRTDAGAIDPYGQCCLSGSAPWRARHDHAMSRRSSASVSSSRAPAATPRVNAVSMPWPAAGPTSEREGG